LDQSGASPSHMLRVRDVLLEEFDVSLKDVWTQSHQRVSERIYSVRKSMLAPAD
jgi:hypothetical protein